MKKQSLTRLITLAGGLLLSTFSLAATCPDLSKLDSVPKDWALNSIWEITLPAEFLDAKYVTHFGTLQGTMTCNYLDSQHAPFFLSKNDVKNPNPHLSDDSPWYPSNSPFKHLRCEEDISSCEF